MRAVLRLSVLTLAVLAVLTLSAAPAGAVTRAEAIARARQWVDAGMPYCQCPNGGSDSHGFCGGRPDNPDWDAYRSDCSGLVSWSWGVPPPGHVTWTFAPYDGSVSHEIAIDELRAGDALNTNEDGHHHIALFVEWAGTNVAHVIEESHWGTNAHDSFWNLVPDGNTLVSWARFHPIRANDIAEDCPAHCEGSTIVGSDCGRGDCAVFGANCADDALGVRCVFFACPPQGETDACLPDGRTIIHCRDGQLTSQGDCGAFAAYCSTQGSNLAHCASYFCADPSQPPVVHDGCALNAGILHCDANGTFVEDMCPGAQHCTTLPAPHCVDDTGCPPDGDVWQCDGNMVRRCYAGNLVQAIDCGAQHQTCELVDGRATCGGHYDGDPGDAVDAGAVAPTPDAAVLFDSDAALLPPLPDAEAPDVRALDQEPDAAPRPETDDAALSAEDAGADSGTENAARGASAEGGCATVGPGGGYGRSAWPLGFALLGFAGRRRSNAARTSPKPPRRLS